MVFYSWGPSTKSARTSAEPDKSAIRLIQSRSLASDFQITTPPTPRSHHLGDAEAVPEVVEGDAVVVAVDLKQEVLQDVQLDVQRRQEVQVGEHHLQQHQHLRLLPLPVDTAALNHCQRPPMTCHRYRSQQLCSPVVEDRRF